MSFDFLRLGFVARLAQAMRDRRARARQRREFSDLAACGTLASVLAEAGLSRSDLPVVVRSHPQSGRRHAEMRRWTGVETKPLPPIEEVRDAQMRCIRCASGSTCDDWLAIPATERPVPEFCPNIGTFRRLRAWQSSRPR